MNISRILLALLLIVGAGGAVVGGTGAFFSDTETSVGNIFTAGELDLLVDNDSWYNGSNCVGDTWVGGALFPVGTPCDTSWPEGNLNDGVSTLHKFFNFNDVKPDDEGEDTISLHVQNDAWMCMDVTLTSNDDVDCTEPELADDPNCVDPGPGIWDGDLAQAIQMFWWADDGDNVYETDELTISGGVKSLLDLASTTGAFSIALADKTHNVWGAPLGTPVPGTAVGPSAYIAKAWCFGTLTTQAVGADLGVNPGVASGVLCNGENLNNAAQTDQATLDVEFSAVQARNNPNFLCDECVITNENVLIDGSFENPVVANPALWDIFPSPAGGWQVAWRGDIPATFGPQNRPAIANLEFHRGVLGPADQGLQYAELDTDWAGPNGVGDGEPASVTIYQDIATTPGATYEWSYAFSPRPNTAAADNRIEMRWGGDFEDDTLNVAGGGANSWSTRTGTVVATTTTTRIQFTDLGTANSLGSFVDDFKLVKIAVRRLTTK